MFTVIFAIAIVSAAAAGYMFATLVSVPTPAAVVETPAPVPSPEAQPVEAVAEAPAAPVVEAPAADEASITNKPRRTSNSAKHSVGEVNEEGKVWTEYAEGKFGWRSTGTKKEAGKKEVVAEAKTEHKPSTRAKHYAGEVREDGKVFTEYAPGKFGWRGVAGSTKPAAVKTVAPKATEEKPAPAAVKNEEKPAAPVPAAPVAPAKPVTEHTKAELLEAIKQYNGVNVEKAAISVKIGKTECTICTINSTCAILNDGREVKLTAVPFSKAILENIIVACNAVKAKDKKPAEMPAPKKRTSKKDKKEQPADAPATPSTEAPKAAPKEQPADVQPMTDAEKAATEAAEALAKTLNNRNVATVTFTDSIIAKAVNKDGVEREIEITGIRRHNGVLYMTCSWGKTNASYQLEKVGRFINAEVIRTMAKQVNAALGGRKNANARITKIESAA